MGWLCRLGTAVDGRGPGDVRTAEGVEVEMQVRRDFFARVKLGDTLSKPSPDANPAIVN